MFIKQPFDEFLGLVYERTSPTQVVVRLPLKALHFNSLGVVHGGIVSTLADVAMSNLIEPDDHGVQSAVTMDLHMSFLNGAVGKTLEAEANIVKKGARVMYADCLIYNEERDRVAKASGTFFIKQ